MPASTIRSFSAAAHFRRLSVMVVPWHTPSPAAHRPAISNLTDVPVRGKHYRVLLLYKRIEPEKEGLTAWGNEVGGLQAGLGFSPAEKRAYRHGEKVRLVVRVRNVGKQVV